MNEAGTISQDETRTTTVAARVTKAEKDALKLVAAFDETTESDLLRDSTITEVMQRATRIRKLIPSAPRVGEES